MPVHCVAIPRECGERKSLVQETRRVQMAEALMQSVLLTETVKVLPHYHPKHWVQLQQGGDTAIPSAGEHLEGAENLVQLRDIKLEVGRSQTKAAAGFYSTGMLNSLCLL